MVGYSVVPFQILFSDLHNLAQLLILVVAAFHFPRERYNAEAQYGGHARVGQMNLPFCTLSRNRLNCTLCEIFHLLHANDSDASKD